jgi:hypothetical protein
VSLHPLRESDLGWLRQAELSEFLAFRWRHRGEHIPPGEIGPALWSSTFVNFVVASQGTPNEPAGIVSAYELDMVSMHCKVAVASFSATHRTVTFRGLLLTLDYLFAGWPLRKIYFDIPAYNVAQIGRALRTRLSDEGVLREHIYLNDQFHDLRIAALYRDRWREWKDSMPSLSAERGGTVTSNR